MRLQRRRDTGPELLLRRRLHALGLRFRLQRLVPGTRRRIDIAFPRARVAVDVRGCFWHSCEDHGSRPEANSAWWSAKLARNRERDADTVDRLLRSGWDVVVVWEHEAMDLAAQRALRAVRIRSTEQVKPRDGPTSHAASHFADQHA